MLGNSGPDTLTPAHSNEAASPFGRVTIMEAARRCPKRSRWFVKGRALSRELGIRRSLTEDGVEFVIVVFVATSHSRISTAGES